VLAEVAQDVEEVLPDAGRQHVAVVERRAPARRGAVERALPQAGDEGTDEELLGEAHPRVGRHLEAAELDEA
jgi:hypothetical protein